MENLQCLEAINKTGWTDSDRGGAWDVYRASSATLVGLQVFTDLHYPERSESENFPGMPSGLSC